MGYDESETTRVSLLVVKDRFPRVLTLEAART
jgi:hypothetical protein